MAQIMGNVVQKSQSTNFDLIIAIDGIDGAGKTTLIKEITNKLEEDICVYRRTEKGSFTKRILNSFPIKQAYFLQIPIYLLLAKKNYAQISTHNGRLLIMDRCFLSNICYFYPKALQNKVLFRLAMFLEVKLNPNIIFILDEDESIACMRAGNQKKVGWLKKTRQHYLNVINHASLINCKIDIISKMLTISEKRDYIIEQINHLLEEKHGS